MFLSHFQHEFVLFEGRELKMKELITNLRTCRWFANKAMLFQVYGVVLSVAGSLRLSVLEGVYRLIGRILGKSGFWSKHDFSTAINSKWLVSELISHKIFYWSCKLLLIGLFVKTVGGNQRELARAKAQKKQLEQQKKKGADDKGANAGLTLEQRRER